jgi:hypothetical protein
MTDSSSTLSAYDLHCAGASRCASVIGLISADHPQLWSRRDLITRCAETLREDHGYAWEPACIRAERIYAGTVQGSYVV